HAAPAAQRRSPQGDLRAREPARAAGTGVRGRPLVRRRDANRAQHPGRARTHGAGPRAPHVPRGVSAHLEPQVLLHADPRRSAPARRHRGDAAGHPRRASLARVPHRPSHRPDGGQSLFPRGERAEPRGDRDPHRRARRIPAGPRGDRPGGAGHGGGAARRPRESSPRAGADAPPGRLGHRPGRAARTAVRHRRAARGRAARHAEPAPQCGVPVRDEHLPDDIYTFRHALTQAVVYTSLPEAERRALHARIFQTMEGLWPDAFGELADRLAHHAFQGQMWEKAVTLLAGAGERAFARSANHEAVASFEQALQALDHLADTRATRQQRIDLHLGMRNALTLLADTTRTLQHLRQASALAEQIGDYHKLGRALSFEANALYLIADYLGAIKTGSRALAIADTLENAPLRTATLMYLGRAHQSLGEMARAIDLLSQVIASLPGERAREHLGLPVLPAVFARSYLAVCLSETGRFGEALRLAEESIQLAEERKHPDTSFWAYKGAGVAHLLRGDAE